ncbi:NLGN4X [Branchiostoma lanceolatum]|uniref:NLGN4X protein n=1 Tax=Branchiostoma lanceolatum TaxID=7740 RepID=A0A8J9Z074_BRALA|nr:NLGN4X [Branchiostoma lanceolatum]
MKPRLTALAFMASVFIMVSGNPKSDLVVTTKYGPVRGRRIEAPKHGMRAVRRYLGIPYARPPVGDLRFKPPQTPLHWVKEKDCTTAAAACLQVVPPDDATFPFPPRFRKSMQSYLTRMDEDCLHLNIYSPEGQGNLDREEMYPLAVLVFIHGGGYTSGTANAYDGTVLASHGLVVVVTVNYRLGVFGFLSTGDKSAPGNYGIMDQIAALQWISDNIGSFNGDPTRITLVGFGTGASSVNLLTMSPKSAGLFRRAILQSGSALSTWSMAHNPRHSATILAEKVGCCREDTFQTLQCLRSKRPNDLLIKEATFSGSPFYSMFGPVVDGTVITDNPRRLLEGDLFRSYDLMLGIAENDGYNYVGNLSGINDGLPEDAFKVVVSDFVNHVFPYRENEIQDAILFIYTNWGNDNNETRRRSVVRMFTEQQIAVPIIDVANSHSLRNTESSTYFYCFTYRADNSPFPKWAGAVNGEELPFLFGAPLAPLKMFQNENFSKAETMLSAAIMTYWSNFAKSGNPEEPKNQETTFIHERPNRYERIAWEPYSVDNCSTCWENFMYLGMNPRTSRGFRSQRVAFWIELVPKLLRPQAIPGHNKLHPPLTSSEMCEIPDLARTIAGKNGLAVRYPDDRLKTFGAKKHASDKCIPVSATPASPAPSPATEQGHPGRSGNSPHDWADLHESSDAAEPKSSGLSVVIAVGATLLCLNLVVLVVCYKRARRRRRKTDEIMHRQERTRLTASDMHGLLKIHETAQRYESSQSDETLEMEEITTKSSCLVEHEDIEGSKTRVV